jgi:hypothetical protein
VPLCARSQGCLRAHLEAWRRGVLAPRPPRSLLLLWRSTTRVPASDATSARLRRALQARHVACAPRDCVGHCVWRWALRGGVSHCVMRSVAASWCRVLCDGVDYRVSTFCATCRYYCHCVHAVPTVCVRCVVTVADGGE